MLSYINALKFLDAVVTLMGWKKKHAASQRTVLKGADYWPLVSF